MKIEFSSQRREMLLFLTQHGCRDVTCKQAILPAARVQKSLIGNLARHSFSLFDRNKAHVAPNKQDE